MNGPERHAARSGWAFAAPALLLIAVFFFLPVLAALLLSFTDFDIYALGDLNRLRFIGLDNYRQLLQSPLFWTALGNTFYFVIMGGPLSVAVSLGALCVPRLRWVWCSPTRASISCGERKASPEWSRNFSGLSRGIWSMTSAANSIYMIQRRAGQSR